MTYCHSPLIPFHNMLRQLSPQHCLNCSSHHWDTTLPLLPHTLTTLSKEHLQTGRSILPNSTTGLTWTGATTPMGHSSRNQMMEHCYCSKLHQKVRSRLSQAEQRPTLRKWQQLHKAEKIWWRKPKNSLVTPGQSWIRPLMKSSHPPNKCQDNPHQDMIDGVIKIYTNADQRSCVWELDVHYKPHVDQNLVLWTVLYGHWQTL